MLKVGITGGIGSGKSFVCKLFETLGVHIYYADFHAKYLMRNNLLVRDSIIQTFGEQSYLNESLNREYLSKLVFSDEKKLKLLNSVVHPFVMNEYIGWTQDYLNEPYTLFESAIIFESSIDSFFDKIICITCPIDIRIERVVIRDSITEEDVRKRMNFQYSEQELIAKSHFIIDNYGEALLLPQVIEIHKTLTSSKTNN
jgi:dephospho-CoA kinase